jgi:hypothetical protein
VLRASRCLQHLLARCVSGHSGQKQTRERVALATARAPVRALPSGAGRGWGVVEAGPHQAEGGREKRAPAPATTAEAPGDGPGPRRCAGVLFQGYHVPADRLRSSDYFKQPSTPGSPLLPNVFKEKTPSGSFLLGPGTIDQRTVGRVWLAGGAALLRAWLAPLGRIGHARLSPFPPVPAGVTALEPAEFFRRYHLPAFAPPVFGLCASCARTHEAEGQGRAQPVHQA